MNSSSFPSFSFDLNDIPSYPLTYPPKTSSTEVATLQHQETSTPASVNIQSILKNRTTSAEHKKKTTFRQTHEIRLIKNLDIIDAEVPESKVSEFFKSHNAIRKRLPKRKTSPFSRAPQDVREIRAWLEFSGGQKKLSNDRLLKNYQRLLGKQEHVFKGRSPYFQGIVHECIREYETTLQDRGLNRPSSTNG